MMSEEGEGKGPKEGGGITSMEAYLEERAKMDTLFKDKFTRVISVMFTDLKGSTTITETEGDLATRMMLKAHNDTLKPIISGNKGILVKTMGDGTMSYFENAQDAVNAAMQFQLAMDGMNMAKKFKVPILVRIGINTGQGIVEENDIYGDVVNVASRFESSASAGEIYISESTYDAMTDKVSVYCRFIKTTTLKGKKEPFKVYKVFWKSAEIEADRKGDTAGGEKAAGKVEGKGLPPLVKLAFIALIPILLVLLLMKGASWIKQSQPATEKRTLTHSATGDNGGGRK